MNFNRNCKSESKRCKKAGSGSVVAQVANQHNPVHETTSANPGSLTSPKSQIVLDLSKSSISEITDSSLFWPGVLHLILDNNRIKIFNCQVLKSCPCLQNLSLQNNLLSVFGPVEAQLAPSLSCLNLHRNRICLIDESLFTLALKKLYIQQNMYKEISKKIIFLKRQLEVLGFNWVIFVKFQQSGVIQGANLQLFFKYLECMPSIISFEYFIANFKNISLTIDQHFMRSNDSVRELIVGDSQASLVEASYSRTNPGSRQTSLQRLDLFFENNYEFTNVLSLVNEYQQNFLHLAVLHGEKGLVDYLVKLNPSLANQIDLKGHTPLSLAIENQSNTITNLILSTPNINVKIGGGLQTTNLHLAALNCQVQLAESLLRLGLDANQQDIFGDTALHIASRHSDFKLVKLFYMAALRYPIDPNKQNLKGQSCLELLVEKRNIQTLQYCHDWNLKQISRNLLCQSLFNFQIQNSFSQLSLLELSIQAKSEQITLFLLDYNLVEVTERAIRICFATDLKMARRHFSYKYLKKMQLGQQRYLLLHLEEPQDRGKDIINGSMEIKEMAQELEASRVREAAASDDGNYSDTSDSKPQIAQIVSQLATFKPKFNHPPINAIRQNKFAFSFYEGLDDKFDLEMPQDENEAIPQNFVNKAFMMKLGKLKKLTQEGNRYRQSLRQQNYSPNNIKIIEQRNKSYAPYKSATQYAIMQKRLRKVIIGLTERLRCSDQLNPVPMVYFRMQFQIIQQFLSSEAGFRLLDMDQKIQSEVNYLKKELLKKEKCVSKHSPSSSQVCYQFNLL